MKPSVVSTLVLICCLLVASGSAVADEDEAVAPEKRLVWIIKKVAINRIPCSSVMDFFRDVSGGMSVDWKALKEAGLRRKTEISMRSLGATVEGNLDLFCRVAGPDVQWAVLDGKITVSSVEAFRKKPTMLIYRGLVYGDGVLLRKGVRGDWWEKEGNLKLKNDGRAFITASAVKHREIRAFLRACRHPATKKERKKLFRPLVGLEKAPVKQVTIDKLGLGITLEFLSDVSGVSLNLAERTTEKLDVSRTTEVDAHGADLSADQILKQALLSLGDKGEKLALDIVGDGEALLLTTQEDLRPRAMGFQLTRETRKKLKAADAKAAAVAVVKTMKKSKSWDTEKGDVLLPVGRHRLVAVTTIHKLRKLCDILPPMKEPPSRPGMPREN